MSSINIPVPDGFQEDLRKMLSGIAQEVIEEVKAKEIQSKDYMTQKEALAYLNVSLNTILNWERKGLKSIKIENRKLYSKKSIQEFLAKHEQ